MGPIAAYWPVIALIVSLLTGHEAAGQSRLVRSLSGPSGKVVGSDFVLDESRSRFVYPQDRSLTVYFEWEWAPGDHVLVASWRRPDGRVASVSPDVKIQSASTRLTAYWVFEVVPTLPSGTWTVEVRIDGQPAGSHAFELAGLEGEKFTLDRVSKTFAASMVRVHKLDATGREIDVNSGFVIGPNAVAGSFGDIDGADGLDLEFADGRRVKSTSVLAFSRLDDWAIIGADTASVPPMPRGDSTKVPIGGRLALFDVQNDARVVAPVDVGAVTAVGGYAPRIFLSPAPSPEAFGGPVIDEQGTVVGIVGGSFTPGVRITGLYRMARDTIMSSTVAGTATALSAVPASWPPPGKTLADLKAANAMTPVVSPMAEIHGGGLSTVVPKDILARPNNVSEVSAAHDPAISAYLYVAKVAKLSKGVVMARLVDAANVVRTESPSKKVSLQTAEQQLVFTFPPRGMAPGYYRIDVYWDEHVVWRAYFKVKE